MMGMTALAYAFGAAPLAPCTRRAAISGSGRCEEALRMRRGATVMSLGPGASDEGVAKRAALLAKQMRREIVEAEDELRCEVEHCKKFILRGDGLRCDFRRASWHRRRALIRGAADNEAALLEAMRQAEASGLPEKFMEDALWTANALAVARAEIEDDFQRLEGGAEL
mmetsp:Transcript_547/g.1115  ORF Transcript_547/g.1115 Transcript_547/m.1115 type:complete len:168 (-) Transcript_547:84-587(-)